HRHPDFLRRNDRGGMQDLCAEICQLGGLIESKLRDGERFLDDARVVIVHPVDVGPDLDFFGLDGGTDQGCRVIASASLEVVDLVAVVPADVNLCDQYFCDAHGGQQQVETFPD